jgi:PAS domain S-box-containing protein
MSVRIKTLIVISLTFLTLLGTLYFTSRWFLFQDAIVAEDKSTTRDVTRLLATLDEQIAAMDATLGDWAPWDDTYEFISTGDTGYIDSNLSNETLINLGVEMILFVNNSGQIVFDKRVDLDSQTELPIPESLYNQLQVGHPLLSHQDPADKMAGILSLPEGALIIASQPILTSLGEGPIRGTLIMGRFLNEAEIAKLSQRTLLSISVFPYNADGLPDDVALARNSLVGVQPIFVAPQSETVVSGYTLVNDIYGNPALILRVDTPREALAQAENNMRFLGFALLAIGLILGLVTMLLLERMVITRLVNLNASVMEIGSQGTATSRVKANGNDEIFVLASSVNSMLESLENSRAKEWESEERYKNLATISPVGIFRTDQNGATTYVNPMWCQISGLSANEALGDGWLGAVHPQDKERLVRGWQETTRLNQESLADYRFLRPDGTVVWVMGQAIPEMNSENQIVGYVGTITDITERKRAEEQRKSYSKRLEEMVKERTQALEAAQEQLIHQEKLAVLGQLAGSVGHELRNPLGVISNAAYFLQLAQPDADEKMKEYFQIIADETRTAEKIVTDLLDFSRSISADPEPLDVAGLVEQTLEHYPAPANVTIQRRIAPNLPPVFADPRQMKRVLGNLLVNAYQAMASIKSATLPEGGKLTISASRSHDMIAISVKDSGEGIPPADMEKIFEPLFSTRMRGIGLGLAISQRLVNANGGRIEVQSEAGKGSTFTVYLPVQKEVADE